MPKQTTDKLNIAVLAAVATATLVLAWPRLQASVRYLPVDIAIDRYFSSSEIPSDRLLVLIRFAEEAIGFNNHYRYHEGLSLLHNLRAVDPNTPAMQRLDAYRLAELEATASLASAPAQSATWLRLANIRWILHDEPERILAPWKMSLFTARTDTSLYAQRVEIGLAHREFLDEEGVAMLRDQVLRAWRQQPGSLMGVIEKRDRLLAVTGDLIHATDPIALQEMEAWLEKLR